MNQIKLSLNQTGIVVDNFAGGGGASTGMELALGRQIDIAINHDPVALALHKVNHPGTKHYCESVWDVDPVKVCNGRHVDIAWFSPDCTHFSKAKGGKPVDKNIRGLAWVVLRWAAKVRPDVIFLENVEEFKTWGPIRRGKPIKSRKGETFSKWLKQLRDLDYEVEFKELRACDYGAPTSRKRLFVIARSDGNPILWPEVTHGYEKDLIPFKVAADIIDWNVPGKSVFNRKKQLSKNTMRRIARGIDKFVLKDINPYLIAYHSETKDSESRVYSINNPLKTIDRSIRFGLVTPIISQIGHVGRKGDRNRSVKDQISTIVSKAEHLLVIPYIIKHYSGNQVHGSNLKDPLSTITSVDHNGLCSAIISGYYGNGHNASKPNDSFPTITSTEKHALVKIRFERTLNEGIGNWPCIRSMLNEYAGYSLQDDEIIVFEIDGRDHIMVDIEMRMLTPRELYNAQGFPEDYIIDHDSEGNPYPKKDQIARCGNSVPPAFAESLVRANRADLCIDNRINLMKELNEIEVQNTILA